jgi:hypothetical protein
MMIIKNNGCYMTNTVIKMEYVQINNMFQIIFFDFYQKDEYLLSDLTGFKMRKILHNSAGS